MSTQTETVFTNMDMMTEKITDIVFEKTYSNERWVVFAVDSGKSSLDLFVQTMYINEKRGA